ncbi:phosphorylase family protein [Paraburkholderia tropica]|uniref:phosphorylase family protein n=1 Tax=Paraburkholderia tropica TaxID=92647 RepID=UPI002AB7EDC7|nr:hypothetical protein [Paraburkholderia tropica]
MKLNVLLVEDDDDKAAAVESVVSSAGHMVSRAQDLVSAKRLLTRTLFDAAILDIQIPIREDEEPDAAGGGRLIREIELNGLLHRPRYIVGLSQFLDADERCGQALSESAFGFIHYDGASNVWKERLRRFLEHVASATTVQHEIGQERIDLAVVCALYEPELEAILDLPWDLKEIDSTDDCILFFRGMVPAKSGQRSVVAAACMEPGMSAAAALTAATVARFKPRYVAMTGITGGIRGSCNLGDVVAAESVWDYTNGKHAVVDGKPAFRPAPRVIDTDPILISQLGRLSRTTGLAESIKGGFRGTQPDHPLALKVGPMFTGTAVVADRDVTQSLEAINRKVVAVEMEGYGVACAAKYIGQNRPDVFILKGVSDFADEHKDDDWHNYASYTSARMLHEWAVRFL